MPKIRIRKTQGAPNQMAPSYSSLYSKPNFSVGRTLKSVPRDEANIEAEKGETVLMPDKNGLSAHFNIAGNRHTGGGTPLNVPKDSFVFSDTKKMRIKDPELLAEFGKSSGSYTPADIAKRYNINKYRKLLQDPDSDSIEVRTAEKMIENYNLKLAKLALVQESKKGFPQGIPAVAMSYLATFNVEPDQLLPAQPEEPQIPQMRYGGSLPMAQDGQEYKHNWESPLPSKNISLPTAQTYPNMPLGPNDLQYQVGFWEGLNNTLRLPSQIAAGLTYGDQAGVFKDYRPYGHDEMMTLGENLKKQGHGVSGFAADVLLDPLTYVPVGKVAQSVGAGYKAVKPLVGKALSEVTMASAMLKDYAKIYGIEIAKALKNKNILAKIAERFGPNTVYHLINTARKEYDKSDVQDPNWLPSRSAERDATNIAAPPMMGPMSAPIDSVAAPKIPVRIKRPPSLPGANPQGVWTQSAAPASEPTYDYNF